mmetsp:Transcript_13418/g.43819  ORF Transcript_13418/g.43819 Transcript_13418/m.43819 type:complete len:157 (+) Transcript_13418:3-473(+)
MARSHPPLIESDHIMARILLALLAASAAAFAPAASPKTSTKLNSVPLAGGMSFDRVCREWRCKYTGDKSDSESLAAIAAAVDEFLPALKAIDKDATVNRLVCGSCLDFKLMTTVPLDAYGPWEAGGHEPEAAFLEKIKAIDGVSQVETQTITNMLI